ncbi:MAG: alpha/beta hydrolase [Anaerolineaceae bacterium 4572_78]|nr:MAG: alpha/beta hydrolase [Anaerolineaceae bacterium 4572_78]
MSLFNGNKSAKPPSLLLFLLEGRSLYELGAYYLSLPILQATPQGDGHPILVFPGFLASDIETSPLRLFLKSRGYAVHGWELGRNWGFNAELERKMSLRLKEVWTRYRRKVSLVGWSLGGVYVREVSRNLPEYVRQVITLGSPFTNDYKANNLWRIYNLINQEQLEELNPKMLKAMSMPPPVPATAIYSRTDGIIAWQCCVEPESPTSESIAVIGSSHTGLAHNPLVLYVVADRLAQSEGEWSPFEQTKLRRFLYQTI